MCVRVDLSNDWAFVRRSPGTLWLCEGTEPGDDVVDLPHSWNSQDTFQEGVNYYRGQGGYRKIFQMPQGMDKDSYEWFLRSEGFYGTGEIWLNDKPVTEFDAQYLGINEKVDGLLPFDTASILGIRLTNRCGSSVLPGIDNPDFLLHGGLAGRVWIEGMPVFRIRRQKVRFDVKCEGAEAAVNFEFSCLNAGKKDASGTVVWTLESGGDVVAESELSPITLKAGAETQIITRSFRLQNPRMWSPASPNLYCLHGVLASGGMVVDEVRFRIGFKIAEFRPRQGFFLNGERLELRGCNRHESMPGFGNAMPNNLHREDALLMKSMGLNFVRLSHYPQSQAFLDACDELGLLVYAELASWKSVRSGSWFRAARRQMRRMILRDRNRPSILIWGMGNESRSRRVYRRLKELAGQLDSGRPVSYAENHYYRAAREKTIGIADVWGLNYEIDALNECCEASVLKNVIVTECSNCPPARRGTFESELEQTRLISDDLAKLDGKPEVAGFALWSFNDYATMRKERYLRNCGLVDAWRVPKMAAAFLQARHSPEPFVRLFGSWGNETPAGQGATRKICIISNCDEWALLRNDAKVAGSAEKSSAPVLVDVEFAPGVLKVVGRKAGREVSDTLVSHDRARRIVLSAPCPVAEAEQRDAVAVEIVLVDAGGKQDLGWNGSVRVAVRGAGRAMTYTADGEAQIASGTGRCFLRGNGQIGAADVCVEHANLERGVVRVMFR